MPAYLLHLHLPGQHIAPLTVDADSPADLAAAVHAHARPRLGSRTVDVHLDHASLTGEILLTGTIAGTFTLELVVEEHPAAHDSADGIRWGYTLRDLDRLARAACAADRSHASDITTRYDIAWSAIAEALVAATEQPSWLELTRVGWQAIYEDVRAVRRMYGVDSTVRAGDVASAPRFVRYWTRRPDDHEEHLVERIAVHQVLAAVRELDRAAVVALAVHDDYQLAADSLGIDYKALVARIGRARRAFRASWFAPETAPRQRGTDRRVASRAGVPDHCPQGHEYTPENTIRRPSSRTRRCRECERARDAARRSGRVAA